MQVAVIAGNMDLGEVIKSHNEDDVGKCKNKKANGLTEKKTNETSYLVTETRTLLKEVKNKKMTV